LGHGCGVVPRGGAGGDTGPPALPGGPGWADERRDASADAAGPGHRRRWGPAGGSVRVAAARKLGTHAPRPSTSGPAGPAATGTPHRSCPARPPAVNGSPPSSLASPHATGPATSWPSCWASYPQHAHPARRMGTAGLFTRTGPGTCNPNTLPAQTPSTNPPDP
jgi:hypothetical protein